MHDERAVPRASGTDHACLLGPRARNLVRRTTEQTLATGKQMDRTRTIRELQDLIVALDRRIPRVDRGREISIAYAAAELKREAVQRIEELEQ